MPLSMKDITQSNRQSGKKAVICICSAHRDVIEASFAFLKNHPDAVLSIESTVQQVNQEGGYTGMKPVDFVKMVRSLAKKYGIVDDAYFLAGDHLGPNVWKNLSGAEAMEKSLVLVREYVKAGYTKLHIDPSMACKGDAPPLSVEIIAQRTAAMIKIAEESAVQVFGSSKHLFYVVGTEVPVPGGAQEFEDHVAITPINEVSSTISVIQEALKKEGLSSVWERVHGLVVQPGVEFGDEFVAPYKAGQAKNLFKALEAHPQMVYEAHSTDYQSPEALKALVNDHYGILKVGPELTFAWREALFALDMAYGERNPQAPSLRSLIEKEMSAKPNYWQAYYQGTEQELAYKRIFSLSDRIRYYWADPVISKAVEEAVLRYSDALNYALVSQYLPWVLDIQRQDFSAPEILRWSVERIISKYYQASLG